MHTIKITPNLLLEYQCTSGKFIRLPNLIEKIDSVVKIEWNRNFFCLNWNALLTVDILLSFMLSMPIENKQFSLTYHDSAVNTRRSAIAEGLRDVPCQLKPCKISQMFLELHLISPATVRDVIACRGITLKSLSFSKNSCDEHRCFPIYVQ